MNKAERTDKIHEAISKLAIKDEPLYITIADPEIYRYWIEKYGDGSPEHPFKDPYRDRPEEPSATSLK